MNVLPQDVYALAKPPVFLPAFLLRGAGNANGANLMNAAACAGFGRFGDGTYMFLYAEAESGGMYLVNELSHLHNLTAVTGTNARPAMIFAGKTYGGVYARVLKSLVPKNKNVKGFVDFHEAYKKAEIPIHLLSADETGALQLAVMARPDCKAKIARAAFGERHTPFDPEIPEADGAVCGLPLIVGIDMDIRRAKKVWEKAAALGRKEVLLAALPAQIKSFYLSVLPRGGIVTPLAAPDELLSSAFGKGFSLWEPELLPAKDAKGEFIRV
jgi:hypothetical protein